MSPTTTTPPAGTTASAPAERGGRTVARSIWVGVTYGLLGLVLALAAIVIVVPRVLGGVPLTVLSGSMEPNLPVGSLAVVLPVEPEDVHVGDVVTYLPNPDDPTAITHRVTAITHHQDGSRTFTLRGDANDVADEPVQEHQVRARLAYAVPWLGHVNAAVNGEERAVAVYVVAGSLFLWALRLWYHAWRDRRAPRTVGA